MSSVPLGHGNEFLRGLRSHGDRVFHELGLPSSKHEDWRYSNAKPLSALPLPVPARPDELHIADLAVADAGIRVYSIDGHFFADATVPLPGGVTIGSLLTASAAGHPAARWLGQAAAPEGRALTALNTASFDDGVLIDIDADANPVQPIHVVHVTRAHDTPMAIHPRVLVRVGRGARVTLIESYVGGGAHTLENAVTEVHVADGADVEHVRWTRGQGAHVGAAYTLVERDGRYRLHEVTAGTRLAREEIRVSLRGPGADASIGGLLLGRGDDLVDHQVLLEHAAPSTSSDQSFKSILDDHSTGSFAGKVVVRSNAAGTSAAQSSRALLLSGHARANAKPQLEIYTDDVRCTHGSTSGQLDEDALFYLRARGIDAGESTKLLTLAFAGEWFERIRDPQLREAVGGWVRDWLDRGES